MISLRELEAEFKGKIHRALAFDGKDDYVYVGDLDILEVTEKGKAIVVSFTTADNIIDEQNILGKKYSLYAGSPGYIISIKNGGLYAQYSDSSNWVELSYTAKPFTRYFIVFNIKPHSFGQLYINGNLISHKTHNASPVDAPYSFYVGRAQYNGLYFKGTIEMVMIYDKILSEAEVKYLYYNPFDPIDLDSLVLWLTPASIDVANGKWWDLSKYRNHGVIYGATEVKLTEEEVIVL